MKGFFLTLRDVIIGLALLVGLLTIQYYVDRYYEAKAAEKTKVEEKKSDDDGFFSFKWLDDLVGKKEKKPEPTKEKQKGKGKAENNGTNLRTSLATAETKPPRNAPVNHDSLKREGAARRAAKKLLAERKARQQAVEDSLKKISLSKAAKAKQPFDPVAVLKGEKEIPDRFRNEIFWSEHLVRFSSPKIMKEKTAAVSLHFWGASGVSNRVKDKLNIEKPQFGGYGGFHFDGKYYESFEYFDPDKVRSWTNQTSWELLVDAREGQKVIIYARERR